MEKYFLGIDGGGTKTALCLIDENLNMITTSISGPTSYDTVDLDTIKNNIIVGISQLSYAGEIVSVFAGLGGVAKSEDKEIIKNLLLTIPSLSDSKIEVDNDVVNAYYSAFGDENGIVAIIGTGSVAYGINNGKTHRCGGYCYQEGDAGSSYDLGRKALQYYAKVIDKRMPETDFSKAIGQAINTYCFADLAHYFIKATRTEIASIARIVTQYQNNEIAAKIINDSVDSMLEIIFTVYRELKFEKVNFSIIGSLGNADTLYKELLFKKINESNYNIQYIKPKYEAYLGSSVKAIINYNRR